MLVPTNRHDAGLVPRAPLAAHEARRAPHFAGAGLLVGGAEGNVAEYVASSAGATMNQPAGAARLVKQITGLEGALLGRLARSPLTILRSARCSANWGRNDRRTRRRDRSRWA